MKKAKVKDSFKVYYAHSIRIYNTKREKMELRYLKRFFTAVAIFNPNRNWGTHDGAAIMKRCLDKVKESSILTFSLWEGLIGRGVHDEIMQAFKCKIPVYYLSPDADLISILRSNVEIVNPADWVHYAEISHPFMES